MKTITIRIPVPTIRNPLAALRVRRQATGDAEGERIAKAVREALQAERAARGETAK